MKQFQLRALPLALLCASLCVSSSAGAVPVQPPKPIFKACDTKRTTTPDKPTGASVISRMGDDGPGSFGGFVVGLMTAAATNAHAGADRHRTNLRARAAP